MLRNQIFKRILEELLLPRTSLHTWKDHCSLSRCWSFGRWYLWFDWIGTEFRFHLVFTNRFTTKNVHWERQNCKYGYKTSFFGKVYVLLNLSSQKFLNALTFYGGCFLFLKCFVDGLFHMINLSHFPSQGLPWKRRPWKRLHWSNRLLERRSSTYGQNQTSIGEWQIRIRRYCQQLVPQLQWMGSPEPQKHVRR